MTTTGRGGFEWGPDRARDLHDSVLQRLFGAGLTLQSTLATITDPRVQDCVRHSLAVLDEIIVELRSLLHVVPENEAAADRHGRRTADPGPSALSSATPEPQE